MKILHILDHSIPLHSGYTFRSRAIIEEQRNLGWATFHITSAKHKYQEEEIEEVDGLEFYRTKIQNQFVAKLPIINQWAIVKSLKDRLDQIIPIIKPDILHAHSPALNGLAALEAGKKHHIPVVYECRAFWEDAAVDHGTTTEGSIRYRITHGLETYVFKRSQAITTICDGLRNDIIKRGLPENKITVIPNAVNIEKFKIGISANQKQRGELGLADKVVLGFIGSFYAYEGIPLLLEAMPEIIRVRPEVRLLLVGGGPQEQLIKQKTNELGLNQNVIFTGRVPHEQVQEYYNQVDIFIYPRLSMRLTELVTPLKPLEAMAQGRLVVASDVGGHRELIKDRQNGYLFKSDDHGDLSDTVLKLIENQSQWEKVQKQARGFVEQKRNWSSSVANYKNIYNDLNRAGSNS